MVFTRIKNSFSKPKQSNAGFSVWAKRGGLIALLLLVIMSLIGWYWSREPNIFWVEETNAAGERVVGAASLNALIDAAETLLDKPGGYLSNDVTPPSIALDNIPNWEYGVLIQVRDLAWVLRNDYSRSQSQSKENEKLAQAQPAFNFEHDSWILPRTEAKYREGIRYLKAYRDELGISNVPDAQFYARADNLSIWLAIVEQRLGDMSQQLSAAVGPRRINTDLAGDASAVNSTAMPEYRKQQTPWLEIDNVFYQARGTAWALVHFLRAAEIDFQSVLEDKNARVSMRQIIRELEDGLKPVRSPVILNGGGYGLTANHSLVLASYISRANSAVINLRELLQDG